MRLTVIPVLVAGASLVASQPLRVIVEGPSDTNANIRFGHALANANVNGNDDNVAHLTRPTVVMTSVTEVKSSGRHFCGSSIREKAIQMSNAFRHALGLPLIELEEHHRRPHPHHKGDEASKEQGRPHSDKEMHIMPLPFIGVGALPNAVHPDAVIGQNKEILQDGRVVHFNPHHHPHHLRPDDHRRFHHMRHGSFLRRMHRAIMALGPWEGRAVAFVLGCGIGVLLRMFWVLAVLAYRAVSGTRDDDTLEENYIIFEQDAESIFIPPPQYTDEKVEAVVAPSEEAEHN